ncbi:(R)-stereoselective amidase [Arenibacter antarcticus]|mgnify:FL=1|jgi:predicted amidohydrolase|uniref:Nitrilase family protein n=1 Tax=Arenibacter antarcticus TaxID=2040469 RepID=A0ABW5VA99_9FLAO|nr:nitrilase family protein [Arenibacter sp. H213]MCM4167588.1 nitrilase [Arenibacter sp. H213]|tara:strand:+ start:9167 stop:10117 length:951 start_codon:yes stop_codon:yes gene_type:complete
MEEINIAVAQFQPKDGDKTYNLSVIRKLTERAKAKGADVISFHEMSITAYTFTKDLGLEDMMGLAEEVPNGKSTQELISISQEFDVPILAGLVEKENGKLFNTYICVTKDGIVTKYRKLHPFISKYMSAGQEYCVFELFGWKCGILICYDNNVIENVRATSLLGAELIFAPHVTGCTPSAMPGRGYVEDRFWQNRQTDPVSLRLEFDGPKGRRWLMRWLPARAYDNGVYYAFTNPIGYDGEHLKNGNSMIIDPYGEILSEIRSFEDNITISKITKEKIKLSGGRRYKNARKPELYKTIIGAEHESNTTPVWMYKKD